MLLISFKADTDKPAYIIYGDNDKVVSYDRLLEKAKKSDIVLIGELHNNPICHWLQLEITKDIFKEKGSKLVMGAEMFEADDQLILDEYLSGMITSAGFEKEVKLWNNYRTDYKPLVEFASKNNLKFVASNIPRRYASMVYKGGFEALDRLSEEARKWIAPLPVKYDPILKGYKSMLDAANGHGGDNLPKAQAIKDATMAYFILKNRNHGEHFIHYNGAYHSNNFEGIVWYLKQENPNLKILTVSAVEQEDISKLSAESSGIADFIICIPETMTKTY